ncbi:hypothetical protein SERLADRAFT_358057, partial [Serpula lacrymans var. lacrymans S7.9]
HRLELGSRSSTPSHRRRPRIFFFNSDDPYYTFTNRYPSPVKYGGKIYLTSEHLFQSLKVRTYLILFRDVEKSKVINFLT